MDDRQKELAEHWIGQVIDGPFWSEPMRVLGAQAVGDWVKLKLEGIRSRQTWENFLGPEQLAQLTPLLQPMRDGQGNAEAAFLALEAHRIHLAYLFDPLLAVTVAQVDPLPHQIEAVYHNILRNPRLRFLLADDPGAGKTIMAGLVLKELKYRGLVQRTLIVVPGHLREQWKRELKERFNEEFVTVERAVMSAYWGRNIWQELSQVITSIDFAKQEDVLSALKEARWDLVIVDEAHKMAAYQYGGQVTKTERYRLGEALSRGTSFMLFLTATPHRGDPENFRLFLDLLEPGLFAGQEVPQEWLHSSDHPMFLRRLKEDLRHYDGTPLFPPRQIKTISYPLSEPERQLYNAVTNYVRQHYNRAMEKNKRNVAFAMLILQRRLASSVRAVRASLERRQRRLQEALQRWAEFQRWLQTRIDEDEIEDAAEVERWQQENDLVEHLSGAESVEELRRELEELNRLVQLATQVERQAVETKLIELHRVLEAERIRDTGEKLLVFTESRETMEYLAERLRAWNFSVTTLHGGMTMDERIRAEHEFRHTSQVMVSTEAGGEGINLQFCALMVNYDIPWNPTRLEQRIGRIHRYGQRKEVHVYNMVAEETIEGRILRKLSDKLDRIRHTLGSDRVFDVLGELVDYLLHGKSLRDLIAEALAQRLTLDEIIAQIERVPDEEVVRQTREASLEMLAARHIDFSWVLGETEKARESRLVPEYIERFFERACSFLGLELRQRGEGTWQLEWVPASLRPGSATFKNRFGEVQSTYRRFSFRKEMARDGVEFVAPGHPLLEAVAEKIEALGQQDLERGAVFYDPSQRWDGWLWLLEGEIVDARQTTAGKRLFAVYQPQHGYPRSVNPAALWDLQPGTDPLPEALFPPDETMIPPVVLPELQVYLSELHAERQRFAGVRRKYAVPSLHQLIAEAEAKVADLEFRQLEGEDVDLALHMERRRLDELRQRLCSIEQNLDAETTLTIGPVRVQTVLRVLPLAPKEAAVEEEAEDLHEAPDIEEVGLQVAMAYERERGRTLTDVSAQRVGYDLRSRAADGSVRYIEVKARARSGKIALTPHEWLKAQQLSERYWLYVVEHAATHHPSLWLVQNPATTLTPEHVVIRHMIANWKQAAMAAEGAGKNEVCHGEDQ